MERAKFDWLAEVGGAAALALAGGYAALKAAPSLALPGAEAMSVAGFAFFGFGIAVMRAAPPGRLLHPLPQFRLEPIVATGLRVGEAEEPLLLDQRLPDVLILDTFCEEEELLLQDVLGATPRESRVVQLFAVQKLPSPETLKQCVDSHLSRSSNSVAPEIPAVQSDASAALFAALDELRRTLR